MRSKKNKKNLCADTHIIESEESSERQPHNPTKCRICLNDGDIEIFKDSTRSCNELVNNIKMFGEIQISEDDGLPTKMCQACYTLLDGAVRFRSLSQESDRVLRLQGKVEQADETAGDDLRADCEDDHHHPEDDHHHHEEAGSAVDNNNTTQEESFPCRKCRKKFDSLEQLSSHRHPPPRRVSCPHCAARVCRGSLAAHVARKHTREALHMCHVCAKGFAVKGSLQRHLMIHTDELPFRCEWCAYRCRYKASLMEHTRTHTGERPYACAACPAAFVSASNLSKHSRVHQLVHSFKCSQCDKGFHTAARLRAHVQVEHLGRREHACQLCGKLFGYKEKLSQHMKNVHKREKKPSGRAPLYLEIERKRGESDRTSGPCTQ